MARVLIVGCGCRGGELAKALIEHGYAVRATTRKTGRIGEITALGAEAVQLDPCNLAPVMEAIRGVTVIAWLMGSLDCDRAGQTHIHGPLLESLLEQLVDTPVRGFVYEAAGTVAPGLLQGGVERVKKASATWMIPYVLLNRDPADHAAWPADALMGVQKLIS